MGSETDALVANLRKWADDDCGLASHVLVEAADTIESLRASLTRVEEEIRALKPLSDAASQGAWGVAHAKDEHADFHYWYVGDKEPADSKEREDLEFAAAAMNFVRNCLSRPSATETERSE